jgi:hypothetical protein
METLRPGVYVEEKSTGARPITGVSTSTGAFVVITPRGPVGKAVLVTSWTDFLNKFAYGVDTPFLASAYGAYSVFGFFNNGGTRAWIVRVGDGTQAKAKITYNDGQATPADILKIEALDEGAWGTKISAKIVDGSVTNLYDVTIFYNGTQVSFYEDVSLDVTSDKYIETLVNGIDKYVTAKVIDGTKQFAPADKGVNKPLAAGVDGTSGLDSTDFADALKAFDPVDDINLVVIPESQAQATIQAGYDYAGNRKDCVFIADGASTDDVDGIQTLRATLSSPEAAIYFPWIKVADPIAVGSDKFKYIPVGGHVAGMIARIDGARGVHKAPAGLEAVIRGAVDVKVNVAPGEQDILNPKGINVIRSFPNQGIVAWGARTLGADPKDRYISVRRELIKIKKSLLQGTQWAVFEPNNEDLWRKLTVQVKSFLLGEFTAGAFKGATPAEAFYVKCDAELNTQEEIDAGRVNLEVGVAINKPAEFVVIRIGQWEGGSSAS